MYQIKRTNLESHAKQLTLASTAQRRWGRL